jgi:hypothetical protein
MRYILDVTVDEKLWVLLDFRFFNGTNDLDEHIKEILTPKLEKVLNDKRGEITTTGSRLFFIFEENDKYGKEDGLWGLLTHP